MEEPERGWAAHLMALEWPAHLTLAGRAQWAAKLEPPGQAMNQNPNEPQTAPQLAPAHYCQADPKFAFVLPSSR